MSVSTREQIVLRSLQMSGRGVELKQLAEDLLNDMLENWALEFKYPTLRKVGADLTLNAGSTTTALPSDFGAGMDNLLFDGQDQTPLQEKDADDFVYLDGFRTGQQASTRPLFYTVDIEERVFRFNTKADKSYVFKPIYYRLPPPITDPNEKPWFPDTKTLVQGLISEIYQFKEDEREVLQFQKVERLKSQIRRGLIPLGGGSKTLTLSRSTFKSRGQRRIHRF